MLYSERLHSAWSAAPLFSLTGDIAPQASRTPPQAAEDSVSYELTGLARSHEIPGSGKRSGLFRGAWDSRQQPVRRGWPLRQVRVPLVARFLAKIEVGERVGGGAMLVVVPRD